MITCCYLCSRFVMEAAMLLLIISFLFSFLIDSFLIMYYKVNFAQHVLDLVIFLHSLLGSYFLFILLDLAKSKYQLQALQSLQAYSVICFDPCVNCLATKAFNKFTIVHQFFRTFLSPYYITATHFVFLINLRWECRRQIF